jgi:hypothetical protein
MEVLDRHVIPSALQATSQPAGAQSRGKESTTIPACASAHRPAARQSASLKQGSQPQQRHADRLPLACAKRRPRSACRGADTFVSGFCQGLGGLSGPGLYVVRQTGLVPNCVQPSLVRTGRGLLMVSGEVTYLCLRHAWSLAPTGIHSGGSSLGCRGQFGRAGNGGIPAHLFGDHDM